MRNGILAGGNWILDQIKTIDVYPEQDALANILSETVSNGGGTYNLLVDLAHLRAPFPLYGLGIVGEDAAGQSIFSHCATLGIDTAFLRTTSEAPTSYTQMMSVQSTGRRTFFHRRGANALLAPEHFDFAVSEAKIFHLGYLLLLDQLDAPFGEGTGASEILRRAQEAGMITSIDVVSEDSDRFERIVCPSLPFCDVCFMNEFEAERTTGVPLRSQSGVVLSNLPVATARLLELGVKSLAVIHFAEGAFATSVDGKTHFQSAVRVPKERVGSVVGSGDAFAAGFLYGLHEGLGPEECLRYAVCAAAACVTDSTTSGGLGPLSDCLALGDKWGFVLSG